MKIHGLQKMTLLDYPGKVACTVFTAGCNMRCPFCHNALLVTELNPADAYSKEEILKFLEGRVGLLDGVCITGGEPLLQVDIAGFLKNIKDLGYSIKLDTNGSYPDKLIELVENKLVDYVAMDIKNCLKKYPQTVGIEKFGLQNVQKSIEFLLSGAVDYEFRTTVVKEYHSVEDIEKIGELIKGAKRYFLQNFVDSGNLIGSGLNSVSPETLREMAAKVSPLVESVSVRGI